MSVDIDLLKKILPVDDTDLLEEIAVSGQIKQVPAGTEIIRTGQFLKVVPVVLAGLIKISIRHEDHELMLYYIEPKESCIMSFTSALANGPSKIFAVAEEDSELLLLPNEKVTGWIKTHPELNLFFFKQFEHRYSLLINAVDHLLFTTLDQRILDYLAEKARIKGSKRIYLRHREIAADLGSAREVISRMLKRMEKDKQIAQHPDGSIELL